MKANHKFLAKILIAGIIILVAYKYFLLIKEGASISPYFILKTFVLVVLIWFISRIYVSNNRGTSLSGHISRILLWIVIFFLLITGYAFRFELDSFKERILAVIIPSYSWSDQQDQLTISRNNDGHFYLTATAKNTNKIKFLIDTGASDIALTKKDAIKLGMDLSNLKYTKKYNTANGASYAAPVVINQLTIGEKTFYNLKAHVSSGELDISLLGMSLINDFKDFKITNDLLILRY